MTIMKCTITIDVLYREEDSELFDSMSIADIIDECDDGSDYEMICSAVRHIPITIPADQVENELLEVGNDGTFFDDVYGDEEE